MSWPGEQNMIMTQLHSETQFEQRHQLLQETLRPEKLPFPIQAEYPIVLDPTQCQFSHGFIVGEQLIAHANLWPRNIIDRDGQIMARVGLIGNVATHPAWQGKGIMAKLFQYLENLAYEHQLAALILWSDLVQFYQKLGFQSLGQECLFRLQITRPSNIISPIMEFPIQRQLSPEILEHLMKLRPPVSATVERSQAEFACLLNMPSCDICLLTEDGMPRAYAIIGKGYDMMGVVHEWGAENPLQLHLCLSTIADYRQLPELHLLAPYYIEESWLRFFRSMAIEEQRLDMALVKPLTADWQSLPAISEGFIWGLDSI